EDKHYCSVRNDLAFDEVKTIFEKYYNGDESFQTLVEFKNLDFGGKSGCLGALLLFPWLCLMR
ncbi:MAG: hypothetical protein QGG25_03620, partial [Phycisphaerae bacterium]|nr:hypothetical protein [Phycisphaerae bacterium]